jgi:ABC-2 type transport system permease protein
MSACPVIFATLAAAVGALTGHVAASRAVPAVVAVLTYTLNGLAPLMSRLEPLRSPSPFAPDRWFSGSRRSTRSCPTLTVAVLVSISVC